MAGYLQKSLTQKLGIKEGHIISLLNAPDEYGLQLFPIPPGCSIYDKLIEPADFIQYFSKSKADLNKAFPDLKKYLKPAGSLWISWPKKSAKPSVIARSETTRSCARRVQSRPKSDLNENIIREIGLANGLVDVKVIAVDEVWSGLKFVYRLSDRQ